MSFVFLALLSHCAASSSSKVPDKDVNIWFNIGALAVIIILFLISVRLSVKCGNRRKKMLYLENHMRRKRMKQTTSVHGINLQQIIPIPNSTVLTLKDLSSSTSSSGPSQFGDDDYADIDEDDHSIGGRSLIQNIQEMLGMKTTPRLNDCEYQPIWVHGNHCEPPHSSWM